MPKSSPKVTDTTTSPPTSAARPLLQPVVPTQAAVLQNGDAKLQNSSQDKSKVKQTKKSKKQTVQSDKLPNGKKEQEVDNQNDNNKSMKLIQHHLTDQEALSEELIGVQAQNLYLVNYLNKLEYLIIQKTRQRKREKKQQHKLVQSLLQAVKDGTQATVVRDPEALQKFLEFDKEQILHIDGDSSSDEEFSEQMFGVKRAAKDSHGKSKLNQESIMDLLQPNNTYLAGKKGTKKKGKTDDEDDDDSSDSNSDNEDKKNKDKENENEPKDPLVRMQQTANLIESEMNIKLPKRQDNIVMPAYKSGNSSSSSEDIDFEKVNTYIEKQWTKTAKEIAITIGKQSKHNR